jgi:hypothetical protein
VCHQFVLHQLDGGYQWCAHRRCHVDQRGACPILSVASILKWGNLKTEQCFDPAGRSGALVFTNTPVAATNNFWRIRSVP